MRSIFFSFFGLAFPYDPLNLFPFFVLLSPLPHRTGNGGGAPIDDEEEEEEEGSEADDDSEEIGEARGGRFAIAAARLATAPNNCIIAILHAPCTVEAAAGIVRRSVRINRRC